MSITDPMRTILLGLVHNEAKLCLSSLPNAKLSKSSLLYTLYGKLNDHHKRWNDEVIVAQGPPPNRNRAIGRKVALQKEYRRHPKLCMAKLRKSPPSTKCSVPIATIRDYFVAKQADERGNTPVGSPPLQLWANPTPSDVMVSPITEEELSKTLKRMKANSAPGPDRLRYSAWKQLNPATITTILNTCRINGRIPSRWKQSNTILIHKGNDPNNLDNWRPIALQNTLYKLYAGIVARRVSDWALANNIISPSQKGFLPFEGCLEHSFVLKSIFQDSRRRKKPASVVWLDLRDAFGSVPHSILLKILNLAGLHGATLTIIRDIYLGSTTSVQTRSERTPQIPCLRGVKQGCPLSPILFDLVMEVVIRAMEGVPGSGYQLADTTIKTRTYADDLCAVASSTDTIQRMLVKAQEAAKCFSQHPASNHWVPSGKYTSFGEYRFALKARLNLLPTRTVRKRAGENVTDLSCPRCNTEKETLAHVLNHCPSQVGLIRQRHNNILTRLANAVPPWKGRQYKEQMVSGDPQGLKPDLVVLNDVSNEAYVVDVTMPFEGSGSFAMARTEKEKKYNHLRALLSSKGYNKVEVDAFVVGPLGSWDKLNEMVLRKLSVPRKYATLLRRLCCTEAIKGSFIMWKNHTMGPSRYPDDS